MIDLTHPPIAFLACLVTCVLGFACFPALAFADEPQDTEVAKPRLVSQLGMNIVEFVAFSPDGRRMLTGCDDNTARLWNVETGKELRRFEGHTERVRCVAFSPDSRRVLTGSEDNTARLWDAETGKEIRRFEGPDLWQVFSIAFSPDGNRILTGSLDATLWDVETGEEIRRFEKHPRALNSVAFSPDGKQVLTGSDDATARLWNAETGKEIRRFEGHRYSVISVAFSPDGRRILTGSGDRLFIDGDNTARLWDAETGDELRRFEAHTEDVNSVAFSPDGRRVLTGSQDRTVRLWDAETGKEIRRFDGHTSWVTSVAFSPDSRCVLTGSWDKTARLWDAETGEEIKRFEGHTSVVDSLAFSPVGRRVLTGGNGGTVRLWDAETGKEIRRFDGQTWTVGSVAFSPDGRRVLTGNNNLAHLWDAEAGQHLRRFKAHSQDVTSVAFSPDGRRVLTGSGDKTARLWDAETGDEIRRFDGHTSGVNSVAFSPDSRCVLTSSGWLYEDDDNTVRLWDAETGKEIRRFDGHTLAVRSVAFSPDGRRVLTGSKDNTARLWDAETGEEIRRFQGHIKDVESVAFSPDGCFVLTGSTDNTARLWDVETGKEIRRFEGHTNDVESVAFSPDGQLVLTGSDDTTTRIWNAGTGEELCQLISFKDGTWAVIDKEGRFDASNGGDVDGLHWVVGMEPISLDQLSERYYDPGLLAKHTGCNDEPLREVQAFNKRGIDLFPQIEFIDEADERGDANNDKPPVIDTLRLRLTNRGGGIGKVRILLNGNEIAADARGQGANPDADSLELTMPIKGLAWLKPGEENHIEVQAWNREGYLRSRGLDLVFEAPGESLDPPRLFVIASGTSDYSGDDLDLRFAAKDAEDFAAAIKLAGEGLFTAGVDIQTFSTERTNLAERPTSANLRDAFAYVAKNAKANDVMLIYLAGHGVSYGSDGDYHYLTQAARSPDLSDPAVREQGALSGDELTELIKACPALKRVLILDTCAAGRVADSFSDSRQVAGSVKRAWQRMNDRTGMVTLAGCAADAVSYEASRFGQGLLTYSLLEYMASGKLREDQFLDVTTWFSYVQDRVPVLAADIGGVQQPRVAAPSGLNFDVGRLTRNTRAAVQPAPVKPMFSRASVQSDAPPFRDKLGLGDLLNRTMRERTTRGRGKGLWYIDVEGASSTYMISARYSHEGDQVKFDGWLIRSERVVAKLEKNDKEENLESLAAEIVYTAKALAEQDLLKSTSK